MNDAIACKQIQHKAVQSTFELNINETIRTTVCKRREFHND